MARSCPAGPDEPGTLERECNHTLSKLFYRKCFKSSFVFGREKESYYYTLTCTQQWISSQLSYYLVGHGISDPLVELLALQHEKVVPGLDDPALGRDGPGRVDVVAGDHADRDTRALALLDRGRHLGPHWILARTKNHFLSQLKTFDPKIVHSFCHLNANNADAGHVSDHIVFAHRFEVRLCRGVVVNLQKN